MSAPPLPPLPWVVHAFAHDTYVLVGVFDSRTDLLRVMTRWVFGHDCELLLQFCLGCALAVGTEDGTTINRIWYWMADRRLFPAKLIMDPRMGNNGPIAHFNVSSTRDECVNILENQWLARDVFKGLPFTLTHKQFKVVAGWIFKGTVDDHLAILAWCLVVGKRNGFEGRVNSRVAAFLV